MFSCLVICISFSVNSLLCLWLAYFGIIFCLVMNKTLIYATIYFGVTFNSFFLSCVNVLQFYVANFTIFYFMAFPSWVLKNNFE